MSQHEILEHITAGLNVVASLGVGQKIGVSNGIFGSTLFIDTSIVQGMTRRYRGDSREVTVSAVKKLVNWAIDLCNTYWLITKMPGVASKYTQYYAQLNKALESAVPGIGNMKLTYVDDANVLIELDTIRDSIEDRVSRLVL